MSGGRDVAASAGGTPGESGAATVLVLAMAGLLCFVMVGLAAGIGVVRAQRVAQSAADLAALAAAAAVADGDLAGCDAAGQVAEANGTTLTTCTVAGRVAAVTVQVPGTRWLGREVAVTADARAGPA